MADQRLIKKSKCCYLQLVSDNITKLQMRVFRVLRLLYIIHCQLLQVLTNLECGMSDICLIVPCAV